jgi:hypothetical protein
VASVLRGRGNAGRRQDGQGAIPLQVVPASSLGIGSGPEAHREVGRWWPSSFGQPGSQGALTRGLAKNARDMSLPACWVIV